VAMKITIAIELFLEKYLVNANKNDFSFNKNNFA